MGTVLKVSKCELRGTVLNVSECEQKEPSPKFVERIKMLKVEELEKQLNEGISRGIYLLYGEETFLLEQQLKKIKKNFGEIVKGINYIVIDENNVQELIADIETPAFVYPNKLIIARNTGIFRREAKGRSGGASKELKDKINDYLKENIDMINESVVLVFIEDQAEKNSIYNTIDKIGLICNFEEQKPFQIITILFNLSYNLFIFIYFFRFNIV